MATYLVTGATGVQGGFVVNHLLKAGVKINAVVRDVTSSKAQALAARGVILFQGTHESPEPSFRNAASGCTGIFLNLSVFDPSVAHAQASAILAASLAGGSATLRSVVLSSTTRVDEYAASHFRALVQKIDPMLFAYYAAKAGVEAAVREAGFQHYTILRPGVLMNDYLLPISAIGVPDLPRKAKIWHSFRVKGGNIPHTDPEDVGKYAAAALLEPEKFNGAELPLAVGNMSPEEVGAVLARVSGIDIKVHRRTDAEVEEARPKVITQKFELLQSESPSVVDGRELESKWGIKLGTLEEYMLRNKDKLVQSLPPESEGKY